MERISLRNHIDKRKFANKEKKKSVVSDTPKIIEDLRKELVINKEELDIKLDSITKATEILRLKNEELEAKTAALEKASK